MSVNIEIHENCTIAYVSPSVAMYNYDNSDHDSAPTIDGWYVDAEYGPYESREEACDFAGVDKDEEFSYAEG